jgi:hypothetical protein
MKRIFTTLALALSTTFSYSQVPDFTVTDMNGSSHNLYSYLNAGFVVVIDVSTTWCGPCWDFHNEHFLNEINAEYGPTGTNKVKVLFYEGDAATGNNAMQGTGGNTLGNWTTGVTYPLINESPVQLDLNVYAPAGFPTISVICPSDKTIKADLFDSWQGSNHATDYAAMKTIIDNTISQCTSNSGGGDTGGGNTGGGDTGGGDTGGGNTGGGDTGGGNTGGGDTGGGNTSGITEIQNTLNKIQVYPNPATDQITLELNSKTNSLLRIKIVDIVGKIVYESSVSSTEGINEINININNLIAGHYLLTVSDDINSSVVKQIQVK